MIKLGKLSDIYDFQYGKGNNNPDNGGVYPVYGSNGIIGGYDKFNSEDAPVIGHIGANAGSVVFAKGKHFVTYNGVICKIKDCADKMYGYYALLTSNLKQIAFGSAQPFVSYNSLDRIAVYLPPVETQQKISTILCSYDNLIENNNRRIALLEKAAQELYKEWFARRRNPDWDLVKLSQFGYSVESGSRPKGGIDGSLQEGYPSLGAEAIGKLGEFDFSSTKLVPAEFYHKLKRGLGRDKDILLYKDGAYIGKVTLFMDEFPYKDYAINEHVFLMRSNDPLYQYYLYFTLALPQYFMQMQNLNRNAAQPGLTGKDLDILKLYQPDEVTIKKFNEVVEPILHNIFSLAKQNQNLAKQRDLLLPRLMGGKLEV